MRRSVLAFALMIGPTVTQASTVATVLSGAELRGEATFRFIGLPLYQARLYTKDGAPFDWNNDFGLELEYLRNLSGTDLVEGTLRELERTGAALPIRDQLARCFNDVRRGDRFLATSEGQNRIGFWYNGKRVCTLAFPRIKTRFMAIFLGENTRSRTFTQRLKGE